MHKYESKYAKVAEARLSLSLDPGFNCCCKDCPLQSYIISRHLYNAINQCETSE